MVIFRRWQLETGLASKRVGTLASGALDPIDAAQKDIAGSKDLIASVSDDLSQHYRWLENYRSSEIKHKRRLKRQEVMYQVELRRRRLTRVIKRGLVLSFRLARAAALFLWEHAKAIFFYLRDLSLRGLTWAKPYARAVAKAIVIAFVWLVLEFRALLLLLGRWLAAGWFWLREKGGIAARATGTAISAASAWLAVRLRAFALQSHQRLTVLWALAKIHAGKLARASAEAATAAYGGLKLKGKALAFDLRRRLSYADAWLGRKSEALVRATFGAIATISARLAIKSREISRRPKGPALLTDARQMSTPKPSTALVLVEPHSAFPAGQTESPEPVHSAPARVKKPKKSERPSKSRKRSVSSHTGRVFP